MPRKKPAYTTVTPKTAGADTVEAGVKAARTKPGRRQFTPRSFRSSRLRLRASRRLARTPVPGAFALFGRAIGSLTSHWEVFTGIIIFYALINLVLVGGFGSEDSLQSLESNITNVFSGELDQLATGLTVFAFFVQSGTTVASGLASAYQTLLLFIISLTVIWALRQFQGGNKIRVRDAFYNGCYPLVPVLLVLLVVAAQLLPATVGGFLFNQLVVNGIAAPGWQQVAASATCLLLVGWTLYLLTASVIALYIVTLPDMTPLAALRSAKDIVRHRRATVLRRLVFLPVILLLLAGVVMVPVTLLATSFSAPVYFVLSVLCVPVVHAYMYQLYRSLLDVQAERTGKAV